MKKCLSIKGGKKEIYQQNETCPRRRKKIHKEKTKKNMRNKNGNK